MRKKNSSGGTGSVRSVAICGRGRLFKDQAIHGRGRPSSAGAALVVVLSFVVLLTVLVLAFFSRAMSERGSSNSSASQTRVEIFSQGAVDFIIDDLMQEIVAGSNATTTAGGTIYTPTAPANAVPALVGSSGTNGLENLVKRSANGQAFSPNGPAARASAASTTSPSQNGRSISLARWNKPLLMPPTSASNLEPSASFTAPDWILVGHDGSNPTAVTTSPTAGNYTVGRYAYTIYDEGGLLDANVAGYPSTSNATQSAGKPGLAYADLTQTGLTSIQADKLVAWRNWASTQAPGTSFFSPNFTAASGTNYYNSVLANPTGFLRTSGTALNNGQSDRMFAGRQQLISFLRNALGLSADKQAFQYLGTFSRSLNQPSYAPDPARPKTAAITGGGNDAGGSSPAADLKINPSFLEIRAGGNFTRSDGSKAIAGEPLVKKRFPLSDLAWLTYEGPSSTASAATKSALLDAGISQVVIDKGTVANIQSRFGLTWSSGVWTYRSGANTRLNTLSEVSGREPDFFELLKASVPAGSIGKAYAASGAAATTPDGWSQQRDNSVDAQIMQMAANIIDQSDPDSYPTRISFNDGSLFNGRAEEYRGVEDLPYLSRIREGRVMIKDSIPSQAQNSLPCVGNATALIDPGLGVVLLQPEIWNPHALSNRPDTGPRPTNFRITAVSNEPHELSANNTYTMSPGWSGDAGGWMNSPVSTAARSITGCLTFSVPSGRLDLFREPTIMANPNIPTGSAFTGASNYTGVFPSLAHVANKLTSPPTSFTGFEVVQLPMAFIYNAVDGAINNSSSPKIPTATPPATKTSCIFPTGYVSYLTITPPNPAGAPSIPPATFRMQYQDASGNWVTYDEKFTCIPTDTGDCWPSTPGQNAGNNKTFWKGYYGSTPPNGAKSALGTGTARLCFDPRTSRFGMQSEGGGERTPAYLNAPISRAESTQPTGTGWAAPVGTAVASAAMQAAAGQNVVLTIRPDEYRGFPFSANSGLAVGGIQGFGLDTGPTSPGWLPASATTAVVFPGMFVQNNPATAAARSTVRYYGDANGTPAFTASNWYEQFFADPDGVVRRAMAAWVPTGSGAVAPATAPAANKPSGLPTKLAYAYNGSVFTAVSGGDASSRPVMLNRPFRSVAELGCVFSGTPWRNLDFSTPESGAAALLDTFCINETSDPEGLVAGKVNLNTRQIPVLQAILAGAYKDEFNLTLTGVAPLTANATATSVATALVSRTTGGSTGLGPLRNISELVGKWNASVAVGSSVNGSSSYTGFSADLSAALPDATEQRISRFREASIRALSASGQTRVWNLLIDVVAQSGKFPASATGLDKFLVEGEQRYWVHVAIDRLTGKVIDKQIEVVKE